MRQVARVIFGLFLALVAGIAAATISSARAEPQPAFDRALVERLVRAEESQVRALEVLGRAAERCKR